jgi:GTP-binding protein HflX
VADISNPRLEDQIESVNRTLSSLDLTEIPTILALNKCDRLNEAQTAPFAKRLDGVLISALNPATLSGLKRAMEAIIF